jgi:hypothetical protein
MKLSRVVAAAAVLTLVAHVARAQVAGLPFYPTPTGLGLMASADYYADPQGAGTVKVLRAGAGFGPFGATAVAGRAPGRNVYGATVAMRVFGGGLVPVSLSAQAGVGQEKIWTTTVTYLPVGVAARLSVPLFPLKPFAVGYYTLGTNLHAVSRNREARVTVGADFNLPFGLGAHAAYDYGDIVMGTGYNGWAVGAHFNFRLPVPVP